MPCNREAVGFVNIIILVAILLFSLSVPGTKAKGEIPKAGEEQSDLVSGHVKSHNRTSPQRLSSTARLDRKPIAAEWKRLREVAFEVNSLAWSPDGRYLAMTGIMSPVIHVWDVEQERVVCTLNHFSPGQRFETLMYSQDGRQLISCQRGQIAARQAGKGVRNHCLR